MTEPRSLPPANELFEVDRVDMYIDHGAGTQLTVLRRRGDEAVDLALDAGGEAVEGLTRDDLLGVMKDHINASFARHHEWQESVAGERTDAERLARAFRTLDGAGILAREDLGWEAAEAHMLMYGEWRDFPDARGYACWAGEDPFGIRFGVFTEEQRQDPEEQAAIGREVVAALEAEGLEVSWNGSPGKVIDLRGFDTRRRRFGGLAAFSGIETDPPVEDVDDLAGGGPGVLRAFYRDAHPEAGMKPQAGRHQAVSDRMWRELMYRLTPAEGSFIVFQDLEERRFVQMYWDAGPRLWMESPHAQQDVWTGAHVSPATAEEVVAAFAATGRIPLAGVEGARTWTRGEDA
ncbi:hypothetical protein O4J56_15370 [Nocardiopsis sp. RSe5-2]|uniref:DUF6891 domain-containing protein n=1 Tax=Nocardiopsis endophytica TaxID=3018445 RepID=A0ABT4U6P2_9ACTN|nr:hypothetical protein [Nocardiopsis endophytica]MDA2812022.1 hypothetical protein [Nocardiopsis endophytica]